LLPDRIPSFGRKPLAVLMALTFALTACSAGNSTQSSAPASATAAASQPAGSGAAATYDPSEKLPDASGELRSVKLAQSIPSLSFSPLIIALDRNFFGYQGLKTEFVELQSGATALQAIVGGSIDLVDSASTEVASAIAKGTGIQAIENTIMMTLQVCVRKDYAEKAGVTADSPLADRLKALKGATIGITGPGAVSDKAMRYLLIKFGGLDPNTDTTITQVGGASAMAGALDANQIQAFLLSPPNCANTKEGMVLVEPSDVDTFKNYTHEVLYGLKTWIDENPEIATKAATAIAMGNNYILQYPDEALKILQAQFSKVDPSVVENAFNKTILPQVKEDGKFDADMWDNTNTVLVDAGIIDKAVDTSEGVVWTNKYIGGASLPYKK
jgi:NitT/TauT family transport system substrate-binding protein